MSSKTPILAAAALAAALAAAPAAAQSSGWYIGGGFGMTQADFERGDFAGLATGAYSVDDDDIAPRFFGGYRITPNVGVEFGIDVFGRFKHQYNNGGSVAVYNYDASALTAAMAGRLPVGGGVTVLGRLGVAFTAASLSLAADNNTATPRYCSDAWWYNDCTSTDTNFYWGVGVQFDLNPRWGLRVDYNDYGTIGDEFESGRADIEQWSMNVVFNF